MSETYQLLLDIKANTNKAIKNIQNLGDKVEQTSGRFDGLRTAVSQAAGMLMRDMVMSATRSFGEAIKLGASVETLQNSFDAMAAEAGRASLKIEDVEAAMGGTISRVDLLTSANKYMALNLPINEMEQLMQSAVAVGRSMGMDATRSVNDLSTALGRASPLILDNFGIQLKLTEAYDSYAATLGKTVEELTEAEKKTAFQVVAIEKLTEKAGVLEGTVSDSQLAQERFAASLENTKTKIGELLAPLGGLGPILEGAMPVIGMMTAQALPGLISSIGGVSGAISLLTGPVGIALAAVAALWLAWDNNFMGIRDITADAVKFVTNILEGLGKTIRGVLDWFDNLFKKSKESMDKTKDNTRGFADDMSDEMSRIEYGESPGGIRDVIQAAKDMEKTWNRVARRMKATPMEPGPLGLGPGMVPGGPATGGIGGRQVIIQKGAIQISGGGLEPYTSRIRLTDDIGERLGKLLVMRR